MRQTFAPLTGFTFQYRRYTALVDAMFPAWKCGSKSGRPWRGERLGSRLQLLRIRRRDAHETAALDGGDEAAGAVRAEDDAQVGHVFLHGAAEGGLRVAREAVRFVDDDDWGGWVSWMD